MIVIGCGKRAAYTLDHQAPAPSKSCTPIRMCRRREHFRKGCAFEKRRFSAPAVMKTSIVTMTAPIRCGIIPNPLWRKAAHRIHWRKTAAMVQIVNERTRGVPGSPISGISLCHQLLVKNAIATTVEKKSCAKVAWAAETAGG